MKYLAQARQDRSRFATRMLVCAMSLGFSGATCLVHANMSTMPTASTGAVIYPAKGQSVKQQDKDKYQCYDWARGQTGVDPAQSAQAASASQPKQSGVPAGGMIRGAAVGAAIGELAHNDAGRGAAVGALGGVMRERVRQRQAAQAKQQQAAQQQAVRGQQQAGYERAFGACMEARGYVVK